MPYITIRKAIKKLETAAIIELVYDACQKVHEYRINEKVNVKIVEDITIGTGSYQDHITEGSGSLISSSSYTNKKTTTIEKIKYEIANNPELGYWKQKGLTAKQASNWMNQFNLEFGVLIESLCYCRFEMVDNDRENSEPIADVMNWFFRMIERIGAYPKPKNYKSHRERQIEREKQRVDEIKRQAGQLKKLRQQALIAQAELDFEQILQDPKSDEYKQCLEKIPDMLKKPRKRGSISFVNAMKKAYCELNDLEMF
jgi:hypothetical protein